jgi:hypothetical protein
METARRLRSRLRRGRKLLALVVLLLPVSHHLTDLLDEPGRCLCYVPLRTPPGWSDPPTRILLSPRRRPRSTSVPMQYISNPIDYLLAEFKDAELCRSCSITTTQGGTIEYDYEGNLHTVGAVRRSCAIMVLKWAGLGERFIMET